MRERRWMKEAQENSLLEVWCLGKEFQGGLVLVLSLFYTPDQTGEDDRQVQPRSATQERGKVGGGVRPEIEDPL